MQDISRILLQAKLDTPTWSVGSALDLVDELTKYCQHTADLSDIPDERWIGVLKGSAVHVEVHTRMPLVSAWRNCASRSMLSDRAVNLILFTDYNSAELTCRAKVFEDVFHYTADNFEPEAGFSMQEMWFHSI